MTQLRISEAAALLGVSDDTVRRWVEAGRLPCSPDASGRKTVDGADLAALAQELHAAEDADAAVHRQRRSTRNRFPGLVTAVTSDAVMSQVTLQCGPYRVVSLVSTEAVAELGLTVGSVAAAVIKATNVSLESPAGQS